MRTRIHLCCVFSILTLRETRTPSPLGRSVQGGVLEPGSESLRQLEEALRLDKASGNDRFVGVYSEAAGWTFGCAEHRQASPEVQAALNDHEAITYRPNPGCDKRQGGALINVYVDPLSRCCHQPNTRHIYRRL